MNSTDLIMEIFLSKTIYYYDFDLEDGIVEEDIIGKDGFNFTKALGLTSPCHFDEIVKRVAENEAVGDYYLMDSQIINHKTLMDAYNKGSDRVESNFYIEKEDLYYRISYYLIKDDVTNRPHVYTCCIDITADEKNRREVYGQLITDKSEIEDIVASAQIGIWHIYLFDGEKPRMQASPKMRELLGIEDNELSEEEIYDAWYSRIKKSALPSVKVSVQEMIDKGFSENTYAWLHPQKKEIIVRCGGTATKVEGRGYILRGYHSDVTETVTSESKQKQLLADALEEVNKQKKLLQEALDNYKEADYDRRRDFLTGLRNRLDMFEMLQDVLSGKREQINSMYMMDIDNFKMLNDTYGHTYGDECLQKIGNALNKYSDTHDIYFYRYGGEEILGIAFGDETIPSAIAEDLVNLVANLNIKRDDVATGHVTVSLGYTADNHEYEKMIDKADTAMYKAKSRGKNQSVSFEDLK